MMSNHARQRMQQRAIHPLMIDLLYRYGREQQQNGSTMLFLDKRARDKAWKALQDVKQRFDKLSDAYLVEADGDGTVITVGHRHKRIKEI
jgi:hypothetical protein